MTYIEGEYHRREETTAVKRALVAAGFDNNNLRVRHGTGTAWGWLKIYVDIHILGPSHWDDSYNRILEVAIKASGRNEYQAKRIGIHLNSVPVSPEGGRP
jgi:hypothetical protein